jgi:hypothetical protein
MAIELNRYKPFPVDLEVKDILDARERLVEYLQDQWRDVDFRPRSPFGDLHVTPMAYLETALNKAATRFLNDLDPVQIRRGRYYNRETVNLFFRLLGVSQGQDLPGYGVVQFIFNAPSPVIFEAPIKLTLGGWTCTSMDTGNSDGFITINAPGARKADGPYRLTPLGNNLYSAYLPFYTNSVPLPDAQSSLDLRGSAPDNLVGINTVGNFTKPQLDSDPRNLVDRASRQYARPGFSTRGNVISYISACYPEIKHIGVYGTGDPEVTRRSENLLGISTPETDIYVRQENGLEWLTETVLVRYNAGTHSWIGSIDAPSGVCLFDRQSVFETNTFNDSRKEVIFYSGTANDRLLPEQAAFSMRASHAVEVIDFVPESQITAYAETQTINLYNAEYQIYPTGQYHGSRFSNIPERVLQVRFSEYKTIEMDGEDYFCMVCYAKDLLNDSGGYLIFRSQEPDNLSPLSFVCDDFILKSSETTYKKDYIRMVGGLSLNLTRLSGPSDAALEQENLRQLAFNYSFRAQQGRLNVRYAYDPAVFKLDTRERDVRLSHTRPFLVRSFCTSEVAAMQLVITVRPGQEFDIEGARKAVAEYVNSIAYPDKYQESDVYRVIAPFGVEGIDKVDPLIIHHTTPADYFQNVEVVSQANKTISRSFLDVPYAVGHTLRNHMFFLRPEFVTFTRRAYAS